MMLRNALHFSLLLDDAECRGADFRDTNLCEAPLVGADPRGAKFWPVNMSRTRLNRAKVSPATVLDSGKPATEDWATKNGALYMAD
jgi:uncharacterized protein YjbI with pentapeptide repeats